MNIGEIKTGRARGVESYPKKNTLRLVSDVLILVLVFISCGVTAGLAKYLDNKLPLLPQPLGLFLLLFLGAFGFAVFVLLTWILEWLNF